MATLSIPDLLNLAQAAGPGGDVQTAVAVALAESGGVVEVQGQNSDGSIDRGLWQINSRWHPEVSDSCAYDAVCNAQAAYRISGGWKDFSAWVTYQTGAYGQFMNQVSAALGTTTLYNAPAPQSRSLASQSVVGETLTSPWFAGTWEVTQGWGQTAFDGEPEGHGYVHWHAGVDVGVDCGTTVVLPMGLSGITRNLDNPDGYGTAMIILIDGGPGVLLGHLRQRLIDDNQIVSGGAALAVSNNTGNSTGCHLHFEVRPQDSGRPLGIARYGNDIDPSSWLLYGSGPGGSMQLLSTQNPIIGAISGFMSGLLAGGQVLLGGGLVLAGLIATVYGARGGTPHGLQTATGSTLRRLNRPRPAAPRPRRPTISPAAESRIRPDLQRKVPEESPRESGLRKLREGRQHTMTAAEAAAIGARPR